MPRQCARGEVLEKYRPCGMQPTSGYYRWPQVQNLPYTTGHHHSFHIRPCWSLIGLPLIGFIDLTRLLVLRCECLGAGGPVKPPQAHVAASPSRNNYKRMLL